nr:PH domain-containing protein [Halomonas sp. UBA3074]
MAFDIKTATQEERKVEYKRIADEMFDDSFFSKKELNHLPDAMNEGEQLICFTSGYLDFNPWLIALTDRRVLMLCKGMVYGLKHIEFNLADVYSISYKTGIMNGTLYLQVGTDDHAITNLPKKAAPLFAQHARKALHALTLPAPSVSKAPSDNDDISKLERLAALHYRGVINDTEFAEQKAKILSSQ